MKGDRKSKAVKPESPNDVMANTMKMADDAGSKENLADGTEGTIHNLVSVSLLHPRSWSSLTKSKKRFLLSRGQA